MKFAPNITQLSSEAITCRGLGHRWLPYTADLVTDKSFKGYNVTLVCDCCGTMKHFMLSVRGEYYPATYSYSDYYLMEKGNPFVTKDDKGQFKLQALSGVLPQAEVTNIEIKRRKKSG